MNRRGFVTVGGSTEHAKCERGSHGNRCNKGGEASLRSVENDTKFVLTLTAPAKCFLEIICTITEHKHFHVNPCVGRTNPDVSSSSHHLRWTNSRNLEHVGETGLWTTSSKEEPSDMDEAIALTKGIGRRLFSCIVTVVQMDETNEEVYFMSSTLFNFITSKMIISELVSRPK